MRKSSYGVRRSRLLASVESSVSTPSVFLVSWLTGCPSQFLLVSHLIPRRKPASGREVGGLLLFLLRLRGNCSFNDRCRDDDSRKSRPDRRHVGFQRLTSCRSPLTLVPGDCGRSLLDVRSLHCSIHLRFVHPVLQRALLNAPGDKREAISGSGRRISPRKAIQGFTSRQP